MTPATLTAEALVERLAQTMWEQSYAILQDASWDVALQVAKHIPDGQAASCLATVRSKAHDFIAGPLAPLLAAEASLQRVTAERDDLKIAAGFKPGDFRDDRSREVILNDIAGMRPAMVDARQAAARVQGDADLWTMRMLEEWPGDTLLLRLWRQRKEATKAKRDAEAALDTVTAEAARLRGDVEAMRWKRDAAAGLVVSLCDSVLGNAYLGKEGEGELATTLKDIFTRTALARAATEKGQADG